MPASRDDSRALAALDAAGAAAMRGAWRLCADSYLEGFVLCGAGWPLRYNCLSGYSSVLREDHFKASDADLLALRRIAKDAREPCLERAQAHFSRGYARKARGDREGAARSYRCCIDICEAATAPDRSRTCLLPNAVARRYAPAPCGPLIDNVLETARDNLSSMERHTGAPLDLQAVAEEMAARFRENLAIGHSPAAARREAVENCRPRFTQPIGARVEDVAATKAVLDRLTTVGGGACDGCGAARVAGAPSLLCCSRCRLAYYCAKDCQMRAWRAGHRAACRAPGELRPGDRVVLVGVRDCENWVVEVRRETPGTPGKWDVGLLGGEVAKSLTVDAVQLKRLRPTA